MAELPLAERVNFGLSSVMQEQYMSYCYRHESLACVLSGPSPLQPHRCLTIPHSEVGQLRPAFVCDVKLLCAAKKTHALLV